LIKRKFNRVDILLDLIIKSNKRYYGMRKLTFMNVEFCQENNQINNKSCIRLSLSSVEVIKAKTV